MRSRAHRKDRVLKEPRPLTPREREVLDAMLNVDFPGVEEVRATAAGLRVHVEWSCCPSIQFAREMGEHWPVVEAWSDEPAREVILFAGEHGSLVCLELVNGDGDDQLPGAETLTVWAQQSP
jgi:hypothetical protein